MSDPVLDNILRVNEFIRRVNASEMWWPAVPPHEPAVAEPDPEPKRRPTLGEQWIKDWGRIPVGSTK